MKLLRNQILGIFVLLLIACKPQVTPPPSPTAPGMPTATPSTTPTPNLSLTSMPSPTTTPQPTSSPAPTPIGPLKVEPNPEKGFSWPYLLYAPSSIKDNHILVVPNNTGTRSDDIKIHLDSAWGIMNWRKAWADKLGIPLLVPAFPRPDNITVDGTIASQYLGRGTLEEYWQSLHPDLSRQDLQLIAMLDDARDRLLGSGVVFDEKMILSGYSASGMFVSRFVILHPERVKAAAFGGHGWTTVPAERWSGFYLPYPYGVGDFEYLMGQSFDLTAFKEVPIFSYMGAKDTNGWALPWYIGYGYDQLGFYETFSARFGSSSSALLESAQLIFEELSCSATFVLYPSAEHQRTSEMDNDVVQFFRDALNLE